MEAKFHRETAKIYDFVLAAKPIERGQMTPNLATATIVPMRATSAPAQAVVADLPPRADFGSGWYHSAAIDDAKPPFRH